MSARESSGRRKFLAALGVGGATAVATALNQRDGKGEQASGRTAGAQGKGYQATEHVRSYYRTAKV